MPPSWQPLPRQRADRAHHPCGAGRSGSDLLRCREDIRADLLRARPRLSHFLLRHGRRFTATTRAWTKRRAEWLQAQRWPLPALELTPRAYVRAVDEAVARLHTVDQELRGLLTLEPLRPRVERLLCFRGIDRVLAARGKPKQLIVTAVARELTGFLWAALTQ